MRIIVGVKLAMRYSKSLFSEKGESLTRYRLVSKKKAYARLSSSTTTHALCALLFKLIPKKYHFHADSQFFSPADLRFKWLFQTLTRRNIQKNEPYWKSHIECSEFGSTVLNSVFTIPPIELIHSYLPYRPYNTLMGGSFYNQKAQYGNVVIWLRSVSYSGSHPWGGTTLGVPDIGSQAIAEKQVVFFKVFFWRSYRRHVYANASLMIYSHKQITWCAVAGFDYI